MTYKLILFDLDGTLTDPKLGITKSVQFALSKFAIDVKNLDDLTTFIGPPLYDSFRKYYQLNEAQAKQAISYYRMYFAETGIYENMVYPGIKDLLTTLYNNGKSLVVATSKPTVYAKRIIEHFQLQSYFNLIVGSNLDGTRVDKHEVIAEVLRHYSGVPTKEIIMIGDRYYDILGAKANQIDSVAVLYGYALANEFDHVKPTYTAKNIEELAAILYASC